MVYEVQTSFAAPCAKNKSLLVFCEYILVDLLAANRKSKCTLGGEKKDLEQV